MLYLIRRKKKPPADVRSGQECLGDFGSPNVFAPLASAVVDRKIDLILAHFHTQTTKHWLDRELLRSVARVRGMEGVAPENLAEAFYSRKLAF